MKFIQFYEPHVTFIYEKTLSDIFDNCEEYDFHYEMSQ